jgi:hypothetical protein
MVRMVMDLPDDSAKALRKKEAFLRIYQVIRLDKISKSQMTKFMESVTGPYTGSSEALEEAKQAIDKGLERLLRGISVEHVRQNSSYLPLRLWPPVEKRAPALNSGDLREGKTPHVFTVSRKHVQAYKFVELMKYDADWQSLWRRYPTDVSNCMVGEGEVIPIQTASRRLLQDLPAGKIGFIQEGGCKLRSVANPFLAIQALGEPLKRKLETITKAINVIGTFDQSKSHDAIVRWVAAGREVSSYDLSSFTDRFPYVLQRHVLHRLQEKGYISKFDVEVMEITVNKSWVLPGTGERVKWAVGQPLGFGPSFHLATLTHAALIRGLGGSNLYRVVGDDVAIGDPILSKRYSDLITRLGVEISTAKSVISRKYAEFCGKLLASWGVNPSIKVKLITSADQLVTTLSFYGPRGLSYLSPRERRWFLKVFLPEDLGGLGWSLPGKPYKEWLNILNRDAIALHRLRADLRTFLGSADQSWSELYEWLISFDEANQLIYDPKRRMLGLSPKGISGIAATNLYTHGRVKGPSTTMTRETFIDLVDKAARETLQKSRALPDFLKEIYFSKYGYLDPRQKECKLPVSPQWSISHGKDHDQYTSYLEPNARAFFKE